MKKYWFGMQGRWDYMASYGEICEAETLEQAVEIIKERCPNSDIRKIVEMEGFKTKETLYIAE